MKLEDFDYILPDAFIAQEPVLPQHNSKMLVCELD
jgi:S-adenosylmethionine:tRNA-ribosyltransferase-isomerase (queuine synthetase)